MEQSSMLFQKDGKNYLQLECEKQIYTVYLVFTWIYRKAFTNLSREPENRVQKALYEASLAGKPILLAGAENSANGISWLILVIGSK